MKNPLIIPASVLIALGALNSAANAITVPNGDFSSNTIVTNSNDATAVDDFTSSNPTTNYFGVQVYPGGVQAAFANGGADGSSSGATTFTTNTLGTTIAAFTTYTLTLDVGYDSNNPSSSDNGGTGGFNLPTDVTLGFLAGTTSTGVTSVSAATIESEAVSNGSGIYFATYTYSFTTGASGGFVGEDLEAQFAADVAGGSGSANSQTAFDNVRVTDVAVPEPSTYAMLIAGLGLVGILARFRRFAL